MPKLWLAIGWKVLVHFPAGHLPPHILGHLLLYNMDQVLDEKAADVSHGKLVRDSEFASTHAPNLRTLLKRTLEKKTQMQSM